MIDHPNVAGIFAVYGAYSLALRAIDSFLEHTPMSHAIVIDDHTPVPEAKFDLFATKLLGAHSDRVAVSRLPANEGLIPVLNCGFKVAALLQPEYVIAANSDVLFHPYGVSVMIAALNQGWDLVGPVTNAPGPVEIQDVRRYLDGYEATDDEVKRLRQAAILFDRFGDRVLKTPSINGFLMAARRSSWESGAYDEERVFRPSNPFNSKGQPNPTPRMTLGEDELCGRWRVLGRKIGVCTGAFVAHYRSVSRGKQYDFRGQGLALSGP